MRNQTVKEVSQIRATLMYLSQIREPSETPTKSWELSDGHLLQLYLFHVGVIKTLKLNIDFRIMLNGLLLEKKLTSC